MKQLNNAWRSSDWLFPNWSKWSEPMLSYHGNLFQVRINMDTGDVQGKSYQTPEFKFLKLTEQNLNDIKEFKRKIME